MKTLIASALIATAGLSGAATAQTVNAGPLAAIQHFNQDIDSKNERATPVGGVAGDSTASSRSGSFDEAYRQFNQDADNRNELRGVNGSTTVQSQATYGSDIFARIDAESREND
ncbi:hypothetical protein [Jannaschia sp. 2305UL9-9]|uniref:hypothetical protein n=1 Tax=Jannaschia sp. 2305UL9-9 TaxID=3121638 RepID=UPI003526FE0A